MSEVAKCKQCRGLGRLREENAPAPQTCGECLGSGNERTPTLMSSGAVSEEDDYLPLLVELSKLVGAANPNNQVTETLRKAVQEIEASRQQHAGARDAGEDGPRLLRPAARNMLDISGERSGQDARERRGSIGRGFSVRGFRRRLRVLFTGHVDAISASRSPVIVRPNDNGYSLDVHSLPDVNPYSGNRPTLFAEWPEPESEKSDADGADGQG